jgi:cholesterol transport system auxiliary component
MSAAGRTGLLIAALACCLAGCGSLPGGQKATARQTWLLHGDSASAAAAADTRPCLSLRVSTPASAPGFGTTRMVYISQRSRLEHFAWNEWVDTPARMTAAMVEARLEGSGLLGAVMTGSSDIRTDLRLDSEIKSLQQVFNGAGSSVSLMIKVNLIDVSSRSLLNSKIFSYSETADNANPEGGVAAANRAAERFLSDLTAFIADSIAGFHCPAGGL